MKKSLIFKILYLFLILIVITGASVFATNTYLASQVSYGSTNVEDALNGLFTLKENTYNYSTDEQVIGKWIDNKPIYRKIINCGTLPNNSDKNVTHNISNIDKIISIYGYATDGTIFHTVLKAVTSETKYSINIVGDKTKLILTTGSDRTSLKECYVAIQYTKTTD